MRGRWMARTALVCALLAAASAASLAGNGSGRAQTAPPAAGAVQTRPVLRQAVLPARTRGPSPKLSSELVELGQADAFARLAGRTITRADSRDLPPGLQSAINARQLYLDDAGDVQVYVETSGPAARVADALAALGMDVQRISDDGGIVQGMLPVRALAPASELAGVRAVRSPDRPVLNAGSVTTQGDALLNANTLRSTFGVTGAGVKVGVLSDGGEGTAASIASGDLPSVVDTTTCDVIVSAPPGQPANTTSPGAGAEGTAIAEIVHDLAPGAQIMIGYFGYNTTTATSLDFQAAVTCLEQRNDVVVDDVGFFNAGLYDGTSAVSQNTSNGLNNAANPVRGYYTSVANAATRHYQEPYVDSNPGSATDNLHLFQATASTVDVFGLGPLNIDPIYVPAGGSVGIFLQWNDPWTASSNDYDLYLIRDSTGAVVGQSISNQTGTQNPAERIIYTNNLGADEFFDVAIVKFSGAVRTLDMFINGACAPFATIDGPCFNYATASSSVPNQSDAGGGVVSTGAIDASDPGTDTIEYFSSRGPTNDGRQKPDLTTIDGVSVTGNGGFPSTFFGTSASAPHAAGIAALILSCKPSLKSGEPGDNPAGDRTALRTALTSTAIDLGVAGADNTFGAGRASAAAAATAAGCPPDGDADGVPDAADNCPSAANPGQENNDRNFTLLPHPKYANDDLTSIRSDNLGDACDPDDDNDGLTDAVELAGAPCGSATGPTNPLLADTDGDRYTDFAECALLTNPNDPLSRPPNAPAPDADQDQLTDAFEATIGTNPAVRDTDGDGLSDGVEYLRYGSNPLSTNTDGDTCGDGREVASVNNDTTVNAGDLGMVASGFGAAGTPNYVLDFDTNKDGTITSGDIAFTASKFGACP